MYLKSCSIRLYFMEEDPNTGIIEMLLNEYPDNRPDYIQDMIDDELRGSNAPERYNAWDTAKSPED
jgi:hypothetical protein